MLIQDKDLDAVRPIDEDIDDAVLLEDDVELQDDDAVSDDDAAQSDDAAPVAEETAAREQHKERRSLGEMIKEDLPVEALQGIITGEFLSKQAILSQIRFILMLALMAVIYISNRYYAEQTVVEVHHLQKELNHHRTLALVQFTRLTGMSRQSELEHRLWQMGDTTLIVPRRPPYVIKVSK